jgi:hypothetical protein
MSGDPAVDRWESMPPEWVAERLRGIAVPWWIAGGWALDLFVGHQTRAHGDTDISVLRGGEAALHQQLRGWELFIADVGTLTPWKKGQPFPDDRHAIWGRETGHDTFQLEIAVERWEGTRWSYRRDARIGAHVKDIGRVTAEGIPYLRPDIVLLYKSKAPRALDESDLMAVLPSLDAAQRATLSAWVSAVDPMHRWLARLRF